MNLFRESQCVTPKGPNIYLPTARETLKGGKESRNAFLFAPHCLGFRGKWPLMIALLQKNKACDSLDIIMLSHLKALSLGPIRKGVASGKAQQVWLSESNLAVRK